MFTEDDDGYVPIESTMSLATWEFKVAGEIFASAILQSGPGPGFSSPRVYHYLCHGMKDLDLKKTSNLLCRHSCDLSRNLSSFVGEERLRDKPKECLRRRLKNKVIRDERFQNKVTVIHNLFVNSYGWLENNDPRSEDHHTDHPKTT